MLRPLAAAPDDGQKTNTVCWTSAAKVSRLSAPDFCMTNRQASQRVCLYSPIHTHEQFSVLHKNKNRQEQPCIRCILKSAESIKKKKQWKESMNLRLGLSFSAIQIFSSQVAQKRIISWTYKQEKKHSILSDQNQAYFLCGIKSDVIQISAPGSDISWQCE